MPDERGLQARLQRIEHRQCIAAGGQPADDVADRADGLEQAPEGAEQAEEDHQADQVARQVALLFQAQVDRIEDRAHRRGGQRLRLAFALASIFAIGASSTGGSSHVSGPERRKASIQCTSRCRRRPGAG
jgi:hypothetical protein